MHTEGTDHTPAETDSAATTEATTEATTTATTALTATQAAGLDAARRMFDADKASAGLGIELIDLAPGAATARMRVTSAMLNGHAIGHGGYVFLLADTAFALACNSHGPVTVAAGADVSFLAPIAEGDVLTARAVERVRQGRSGIYDVTVTRGSGEGLETVAEFRGRSRIVAGR